MARQFSRRGVSSQRQYDVELAQEYEKTKSSPRPTEQPLDGKRQNTDRIIADMAQGFVQAQADITGKSANSTNQEMLSLLQKVSTQLEKMQQPAQSGNIDKKTSQSEPAQKTPGQSQQSQEGQDNKTGSQPEAKQVTDSMVSQELQNLFSQILQGKDENNSTQQQVNSQDADTNANAKPQKKDKDAAMTVQTAAQVLAQAQYELSNELEASLKKLKQVISESEKIATKISDLLGEENK
jgi:hypothetical protein